MGSLTSKPKAPKTRVVYVPAPAPISTPPVPETPSAPTPEETADAQRASNLLLRARGNFGTVLTSFRGLLGPADSSGQRKTLLGE